MIFPVFRQFWSGTNAASVTTVVGFVDSAQTRWVVPYRTASGEQVQPFPIQSPIITSL